MTESRWQRWSRKKTEARKDVEPTPPPVVDSEPAPEAQELAINETLPEQDVLAKYNLPDPDTIEMGTDITGFMGKEIPELLRRKALRSLWKSNPMLAVLDGLNDYDEDFTDTAPGVKGAKTLYQVGKGLIDKTARQEQDAGKNDTATEQDTAAADRPEPGSAQHAEAAVPDAPDELDELDAKVRTEPQIADTEPQPEPKYRPRMRFD